MIDLAHQKTSKAKMITRHHVSPVQPYPNVIRGQPGHVKANKLYQRGEPTQLTPNLRKILLDSQCPYADSHLLQLLCRAV